MSAALPVTGPSWRTWVCPTTAMSPSMWHPMSILTISPSSNTTSSLASGEKWQTVLFTEMQVGKATPLSIFLFTFLYTLPVCSLINASPFSHTSTILAFDLHSDITKCNALLTISAAVLYLVTTS
uniref:Proliferation-associated protein 2G4-like n=1 Tax=Rhizophora mucronata TaxID=61149 RepID=A0A2P2LUZ7_RHIMU